MGLLKSFIHLKGGGNFEEVLYINMTERPLAWITSVFFELLLLPQ